MRTPARILVAIALMLAAGCGDRTGEPPPETAAGGPSGGERVVLQPEAATSSGITVAAVEERALDAGLRATAVIRPNENRLAHVSPPIPGRAIEVRTVLGDRVQPGQTLALLDSLELGEKKSAFLQTRTSLEVARRNAEREERLFRQRISSEKEYLEAKGEFERSDAAYKAAREALRLVGLRDDELEHMTWGGAEHPLSHFPITAPFAGTVIDQHVTLGELVTPADKPYAIADLSTLWILLDIYEKDLARVAVGTEVEVRVDAYPAETFAGRIAYVSDVLDEGTRTARARVEVGNPDGRLRPGMFATAAVRLAGSGGAPGVVVPENAVQRVHGRAVVFVEESPGTFAVRGVEVGAPAQGLVPVRAGLAAGERVAVDGAFTLKSILLRHEVGGGD